MNNQNAGTKYANAVRCSALLGRWKPPVGRWMTFDECVQYMANFPLAERTIWAGHKNNPRPEAGLVLSVLERVEPLRHAIRQAELQMARARLVQAGMLRKLLLLVCWRKCEWWAYQFGYRPNDPSSPTAADRNYTTKKETK